MILTEAPRYGLEHVAFKTESVDDLEGYETTLERYGCAVERLAPGDERAMGDAIRFDSPSGHVMEIYAQMDKVGNGLPMFNPPPMPMDLVGIAPPRLDHCLLTTENVPDAGPVHARGARLPAHRAARQQRGPPAHRLPRALAASPTTSPSPAARTAACTTSPSGSTAGRTSVGPPTSCA